MVSIGDKPVVPRVATAVGRILLRPRTIRAIESGRLKKGDVLTVAEVAAIRAAKATPEILPLCHTIPLTGVTVRFKVKEESVECTCTVEAHYRTGVEMEALTGVAAALLTIWDMTKSLEKDEAGQYPVAAISEIRVKEKRKGTP